MREGISQSVSVGLRTAFPVSAVADHLLGEGNAEDWLGYRATLGGAVGAPAEVPGRGSGHVLEVRRNPSTCVLRLAWDDPDRAGSEVTIRVTTCPGGRSRVRITETEVADDAVRECLRFWTDAVEALGEIIDVASRQRRRFRQAVVVVHGIGEQRASSSLRAFVRAVFPETRNTRRFLKPDYVSPLVGAASVTVPGRWTIDRPTTDIYELYWAHLLRDTTAGQVYGWAARLVLLTPRANISRGLRPHVYVVRALLLLLVLAAVGGVVASALGRGPGASVTALSAGAALVLAAVPGVVWKVARMIGSPLQDLVIANVLGDAARYLDPGPANVAVRQNIRETGLHLIDGLHESGRYGRVIVYGHSLGSVIAYDILAHSWTRRSRDHAHHDTLPTPALRAVEDLLNPRLPGAPPPDVDVVRAHQRAAWQESRVNGFSWLVSDLVTAGSPLTHARWLLNPDKSTSFDDQVADRALPTCPPTTTRTAGPVPGSRRRVFTYTHAYHLPDEPYARSVLVPDHGAPFALVRWTNLYFPHTGVMRGDPVGGPVSDAFGSWVRDQPLPAPGGGFAGFAHTKYVDTARTRAHTALLHEALDLSVTYDIDHWRSLSSPADTD